MAALKVKKELLESEVYYSKDNSSYKVKLSEATQEQLVILKEKGVDIFEKKEEK
jgi:hypothetical protein